jgi:DNA (cytosine-5)-methyltransferase 1
MLIVDRYKIKEIMAKRKIDSFTQLAKMLGISKNQLSSILSNKFRPVKSNIEELAKFLKVSPIDIISENKKGK